MTGYLLPNVNAPTLSAYDKYILSVYQTAVLPFEQANPNWKSNLSYPNNQFERGHAYPIIVLSKNTGRDEEFFRKRAKNAGFAVRLMDHSYPHVYNLLGLSMWESTTYERLAFVFTADAILVGPGEQRISPPASWFLPDEPATLKHTINSAPADEWVFANFQFVNQTVPAREVICDGLNEAGITCIDPTAYASGLLVAESQWVTPGGNGLIFVVNAGKAAVAASTVAELGAFSKFFGEGPKGVYSMAVQFQTSKRLQSMQGVISASSVFYGFEELVGAGAENLGTAADTIIEVTKTGTEILKTLNGALQTARGKGGSFFIWVLVLSALAGGAYYGYNRWIKPLQKKKQPSPYSYRDYS